MDVRSILEESGLFVGIDELTWEFLVDQCQADVYEDGEIIFKEGDTEPKGMYILGGGTVIITTELVEENEDKQSEHQDYFLTSLTPFDTFGEMSIIDKGPRSANARASGLTSVVFLPDVVFDVLVEKNPMAAFVITKNIAILVTKRLREANFAFKHEALLG